MVFLEESLTIWIPNDLIQSHRYISSWSSRICWLQALYANTPADLALDSGFRQIVGQSCDKESQTVHSQKEFWKSYLDVSTLLSRKCIGTLNKSRKTHFFEPGNRLKNVVLITQRNSVSDDAILAASHKVYRGLFGIKEELSLKRRLMLRVVRRLYSVCISQIAPWVKTASPLSSYTPSIPSPPASFPPEA